MSPGKSLFYPPFDRDSRHHLDRYPRAVSFGRLLRFAASIFGSTHRFYCSDYVAFHHHPIVPRIYESNHHLYSVVSVSFRGGHQRYSGGHLDIQNQAGRFTCHGGGIHAKRPDQSGSQHSHQGRSCIVSFAEFLSRRNRSGQLYISDRKRHKYPGRFNARHAVLFRFAFRIFLQQATVRPFRATNLALLDWFLCTNGVFYPADSSLIREADGGLPKVFPPH